MSIVLYDGPATATGRLKADPATFGVSNPSIPEPVRVLTIPHVEFPSSGRVVGTASILDPFDCIVLLRATALPEMEEVIRRTGSYVTAVADLSGSKVPYADFQARVATSNGIIDAGMALSALIDEIRALPTSASSGTDLKTALLARMLTRRKRLMAVYAPEIEAGVRYPAAGLIPNPELLAANLAQSGFLRSTFFDRLHVCAQCRSSRLNVREECTKCRSPRLAEESIIHHFRCAEQLPESRFQRGSVLHCPKCNRTLNHFGLDYDKPGSVLCCAECGHVSDAPVVGFTCLDCGAHRDGDDMATRDWFHYELTPMGRHAALTGNFVSASEPVAASGDYAPPHRMVTPEAFENVLGILDGVKSRARRAFEIIEIGLAFDQNELSQSVRTAALATRATYELVNEMLRPGDVMTVCPTSLLILCPETNATQAKRLAKRISKHVSENLEARVIRGSRLMAPEEAIAALHGGHS